MASQRADIIRRMNEYVERRVMRPLALELTAELQEQSPVDTGFLRANFVPSIGVPVRGTDGERVRGAISEAKQQAGIAEVATSYTLDRGPIFVTNNVAYLLAVNARHASKRGFIQRAIVTVVQRFGGRRVA